MNKILCNVMVGCVVLGFGLAHAEQLDVYILTGQSNSLGTTSLEGATVAEYGPGSHLADTATDFFWSNVKSTNSVYPAVLYGDSSDAITTLQMQQGDGGTNPTFWGPEFGFARTMFDAGQSNIMIIKASRGGGGNTFWDMNTFDNVNQNSGHMWGHLIDTVDAALAKATDAGHTFDIKGLMYLQGESNNASEASIADTRLNDLINNLTNHLNTNYINSATDMRTVIGEIAASGSNSNRILTTTKQQNLADANNAVAFVGTSDLPLKSDNIHFGRDAKLEIGLRFANAFIGSPVNATSYQAVVDAADATKIIFEQYVPDINGAANGVNLDNPGTFTGFADGLNGQPATGVLVDGSADKVVFADYSARATTSDIAGGDFDFAAHGFPATWDDSGTTITFTFVDPQNPNTQAVVSGVAFNLVAVNQGDDVSVQFLDVDGNLLLDTGILSDGSYGYEAIDLFNGETSSLIHQVVFSGATSDQLWSIGFTGDGGKADFAFTGFQVIPEPTSLMLLGLGSLMVRRKR